MNRLKIIAHKWYVGLVTFKHFIVFLYGITERIAGFKITVITDNDLAHEALADEMHEEMHEEVNPKDLN